MSHDQVLAQDRVGRRSDFTLGILLGLPICISLFFLFCAVGAAYRLAQTGLLESVLGTVLIFAAPLQLFLIAGGAGLAISAVIVATLVINLRFLPMATVLGADMSGKSQFSKLIAAAVLSASTFMVYYVNKDSQQVKDPVQFYLGAAIPAYITSVVGTIIGYYLFSEISYEPARYVLLVLMPIHFLALSSSGADFKALFLMLFGGLVSLVAGSIGLGSWVIMIIILCACLFSIRESRE